MGQGFLQIALTLSIIVLITPKLGKYIASVFLGERTILDPVMKPLETIIYILGGVGKKNDMTGWQYIRALLCTNLVMGSIVYVLLSCQKVLPWNPNELGGIRWDLLLHTTISFLTNTDQQHYAPENTFSYFSQTSALGFLMFTS
ncbi:MAG: potassium-transporting ATPase subunit KdpA, partial [Dolichospermum circinale Clear-D4]|nr:potassium-transporting ATPase subunit KdpA [Dolichospermum circinale Clear-D4]